jgi:hypothetical protein
MTAEAGNRLPSSQDSHERKKKNKNNYRQAQRTGQ